MYTLNIAPNISQCNRQREYNSGVASWTSALGKYTAYFQSLTQLGKTRRLIQYIRYFYESAISLFSQWSFSDPTFQMPGIYIYIYIYIYMIPPPPPTLPTEAHTTLVPKFEKHPLFSEFGRKKKTLFQPKSQILRPNKTPLFKQNAIFS